MIAKIKRKLFGCKHEWRLLDAKTWAPIFGGVNTAYDYGRGKCGHTSTIYEAELLKWKFTQMKEGATFIDEGNE